MEYLLNIINPDEKIDLTTKTQEIRNAIIYINKGKYRKKPVFKGINILNIISLDKKSLSLKVQEEEKSNKAWHQKFGWFLANKCDMRNFCDPSNEKKMFKVSKKIRNFIIIKILNGIVFAKIIRRLFL